ncbi:hypothetical protein O9992_26780 [Vibrio lentus]|nr:hypothetical protein [Vibrio lentus]
MKPLLPREILRKPLQVVAVGEGKRKNRELEEHKAEHLEELITERTSASQQRNQTKS